MGRKENLEEDEWKVDVNQKKTNKEQLLSTKRCHEISKNCRRFCNQYCVKYGTESNVNLCQDICEDLCDEMENKEVESILDPSPIVLTEAGFSDPTIGSWDAVTRVAILKKNTPHSIIIDVDKATIEGLSTQLGGKGYLFGIQIKNHHNILLQNITLQEYRCGFFMEGCSGIVMHSCHINKTFQGFELVRCDIIEMKEVHLSMVKGIGIYFEESSNMTITDVLMEDSAKFGIMVMYSKNFDILSSEVVDGENLMVLGNCSGGSVQKNTLAKSQEVGLTCTRCYDMQIAENQFMDHRLYGLLMENSVECLVHNNTLDGCGSSAIGVSYSRVIDVTYNTVTNSQVGCQIHNFPSAVIQNNSFDHCYEYGVWVSENSPNTWITENKLTNCGRGIYLDDINHATITKNTIREATGEGLYVNGHNSLVLHNNFINNRIPLKDDTVVEKIRDNIYCIAPPVGGNYWSGREAGEETGEETRDEIREETIEEVQGGVGKKVSYLPKEQYERFDEYPFERESGWANQ